MFGVSDSGSQTGLRLAQFACVLIGHSYNLIWGQKSRICHSHSLHEDTNVDQNRIQTRAYYIYEDDRRRGRTESGLDLHHWTEAAKAERLDRIAVRAYYLWRQECHRVGGVVHANDQHHWYQAERLEDGVLVN